MEKPLSKVEEVALAIYCAHRNSLSTPEERGEQMDHAFADAYRFLDISKNYQRHYA